MNVSSQPQKMTNSDTDQQLRLLASLNRISCYVFTAVAIACVPTFFITLSFLPDVDGEVAIYEAMMVLFVFAAFSVGALLFVIGAVVCWRVAKRVENRVERSECQQSTKFLCVLIPFGTMLAVFNFYVLAKSEVAKQFS